MVVQKVEFLRLRAPSRGLHLLIRLTARDGSVGWGECGAANREEIDLAAGVLPGRPATALEPARKALASAPGVEAGAVMAMLDLAGKSLKAPLYQVLGGPTRNKARAMARINGGSDDEIVAAMRRLRDAGHRAFLVAPPDRPFINSGQSFALAVKARIDKLRAAGGAECDFAVDGRGLTAGDAATAASVLERSRLLWLDAPAGVPSAKIAEETVTPLGGESDFAARLRDGTIDVIRPDLKAASLVSIRKTAALAETYYVAVAPHHDGTPVATAAALHLAASLPNFFIQQIPAAPDQDRAFRAALGGAVESVKDGYAALPAGPGLGITIDEKALEPFTEVRG